MSELKGNFKFEIGEIVYSLTADNSLFGKPKKGIIVERCLNQCHGGVQMLYKVLGWECKSLIPEICLSKDGRDFEEVYQERIAELKRVRAIIDDLDAFDASASE